MAVVQAEPLGEEALVVALPTRTALPTLEPTTTPLPSPTPRPTLAPTPTPPACTQSEGRVEISSLPSQVLAGTFHFRIYLPPCYSATAGSGYPVLYLLHGLWSTDDQWQRMGIDDAADRLISSGQIPPLLIVMPRDPSTNYPESDPFDKALVSELVPWIDAHYHTRPERTFR
ncbi:MAG: esterase family protein, partial [Chloroflexi bacterium]|nr:esterase family protein [Chloroflexota bacterium]